MKRIQKVEICNQLFAPPIHGMNEHFLVANLNVNFNVGEEI